MSILSWLQTWDTAIGAFGSVFLSLLLVILYAKQHRLLKRDLNREVRRSHTETLKKRVREWHGDIDEIGLSDDPEIQIQNNSNLPVVRSASVEPAPSIISLGSERDKFRVVPETIQDDRYLQDLLENHAPELRRLKETIEEQHKELETARQSFINEYPEGQMIDADGYTLRPLDYYPEWVFERAVMLHRSQYETNREREKDIVEDRIQKGNSASPERATMRYSPVSEGGRSTYQAKFDSGDLEDLDRYGDEITDDLVRIHHELIDDIHAEGVYSHASNAAEILDEMRRNIEELRAKLVEHEGHPLYTEDCSYLEDAVV